MPGTVLASRAYETEKAPAHLEPIPVEVVGKQVLSNLNSASWAEGSVEVEGRQLPCRALLEGSREQRRTQ